MRFRLFSGRLLIDSGRFSNFQKIWSIQTKNLKNNIENEGFGELGVPKAVRMRIRHSIRSDNSFFKWCEALFSFVVCSDFLLLWRKHDSGPQTGIYDASDRIVMPGLVLMMNRGTGCSAWSSKFILCFELGLRSIR